MLKGNGRLPYKLIVRGQIYHLKISTVINGQRIFVRESTHTADRKEAEQYAAKRFAQVIEDAQYRTNAKLKDLTIDQAFGLYWEEIGIDHANADDTDNKLSNLLKYFNPRLRLSNLTVDDISRFVKAKRAEGRKVATINRYLAMLSAILNLCKKRKVNVPDINVREFMKPEPFENVKYFDDWSVIDKIVDNAAEHAKPIILFCVYSGCRISNVLNLKWSDIHGDYYMIKVKDKRYKDGRLVAKPLYTPLKKIIEKQPHICEYVFTYEGAHIKRINKAWNRALERAGVKHETLHTLRHTHATWYITQTNDLKAVQRSLNHQSSRTTEKYAHLIEKHVEDEYMSVFGNH